VETIGSKRSYALIWCMPNNDDDDGPSALNTLSDELHNLMLSTDSFRYLLETRLFSEY